MSCFIEFHINWQLFIGIVEVLKHGITNSRILSCNSYFQVNIGKHSEDAVVWGFYLDFAAAQQRIWICLLSFIILPSYLKVYLLAAEVFMVSKMSIILRK